MLIYNKIEQLRQMRNIPKMEFYSLIEMSNKGYRQAVDNHTLTIKKLEKIAEVLKVPVAYFFTTDNTDIDFDQELLQRENALLKQTIELKDEIIASLQQKIKA